MKTFAFIVAGVFALVTASTAVTAASWTTHPELNRVSSIFAMRSVGNKCYDKTEPDSPWGYDAWGYVRKPLGQQKFAHLDSRLCEGALNINDPVVAEWKRALGPLVLIHESYHLRRWSANGSEAKVECKAIRHWKVGVRMLGATEETVEDLWPLALYFHFRLADYYDPWTNSRPYYDENCEVPGVIPPEELEP